MPLSLGIHVGHHASCAVVKDGVVVAALQQERQTRIKHDGAECFTAFLPIEDVLSAAGAKLIDVDIIVSSLQAASPGGIGLHRPLALDDFGSFRLDDPRHKVVSHHLAHAYASFYMSNFQAAAAIIADLGGSTTLDGQDYALSFNEWFDNMTSSSAHSEVKTESLSIYSISPGRFDLKRRDYCIPHSAPESFVHSVASLYYNVYRFVFGRDHCHGQLMALSAYSSQQGSRSWHPDDFLRVKNGKPIFRNDWQHKLVRGKEQLDYADLAWACQEATNLAFECYAQEAAALTLRDKLVLGGGVFLNIAGNSHIHSCNTFERVFVPSAPHDAGISLGCAFYGNEVMTDGIPLTASAGGGGYSDRVGIDHCVDDMEDCLTRFADFLTVQDCSVANMASHLAADKIVARWSGRSEFGPRALGGRSLLASPLRESTKERLNSIKGRQSWRPVAPIVRIEDFDQFFVGPQDSPYMTYLHTIHPEHRQQLPALNHPDGSTRAQTLRSTDDPLLYELLADFGSSTGFPLLVNTSLNGPGEPIVESLRDAILFFLSRADIDFLWINDQLTLHKSELSLNAFAMKTVRLCPGILVTIAVLGSAERILVSRSSTTFELPECTASLVARLISGMLLSELVEEVSTFDYQRFLRVGIIEFV